MSLLQVQLSQFLQYFFIHVIRFPHKGRAKKLQGTLVICGLLYVYIDNFVLTCPCYVAVAWCLVGV